MTLEPKPKKMLKLHRIRDKSCKKQNWQEIINRYSWNRSASWPLNMRPAAEKENNRKKQNFTSWGKSRLGLQTPFYTV